MSHNMDKEQKIYLLKIFSVQVMRIISQIVLVLIHAVVIIVMLVYIVNQPVLKVKFVLWMDLLKWRVALKFVI